MSMKRRLVGVAVVVAVLALAAGAAFAATSVTVEKLVANPMKYADKLVKVEGTVGAWPTEGALKRWQYPLNGENGGSVTVQTTKTALNGTGVTVSGKFVAPNPSDPSSWYIWEGGIPIWVYFVAIGVLVILAGALVWQLVRKDDGTIVERPYEPVRQERTAIRCPSCDAVVIEPDARFCTQCQAPLFGTTPPPPPPEASVPRERDKTRVAAWRAELLIDTPTGPQSKWLEPGVTHPKYVTIGRSQSSDILLPHDSISGEHAEIYYDESKQEYSIVDRRSLNGTFVNGVRVTGERVLQDNDSITFGPYQRATFRKLP